jgi:arginase
MILRTLLGDGPPELSRFVSQPLKPSQVTLVGVRDMDPGERSYVEQNGIRIISVNDLGQSPNMLLDANADAEAVYVHLDYDVLDDANYPDIGFPTPNGMSAEMLVATLRAVRSSLPVVGMSLTEYSPADPAKPSEAIQQIIKDGFGLSALA